MADERWPPQTVDPGEPWFRATVVPDAPPTTFAVSGELDLCTLEQLRAALAQVRNTGDLNVVLDVAGVEFLSACAVGVIAEHVAWAHDCGGSVVVINPGPTVRRVLTLTDHHQLIGDAESSARHHGPQQP